MIKKIIFAIIIIFVVTTILSAESFVKFKLKNGLDVILIKKQGLPLVNINVVYRTGCKDEYNGITGIAHMLEHMNFRGSKNFPDGYFENFVTKNGGIENATTSFDMTRYFVTIKKEALSEILKMYADNMENLLIDKAKFLKERNVVYQERLWRTDNSPDGYLYYTLQKLAYLESPYRWTPIGFASDILHWSRDDVYNFYKKYYSPSNAALIICGDINIESAKAMVKNIFGKIQGKEVSFYFTKEPKQKGLRKIRLNFVSENRKLAMAFHIPPLSDNSTPALDILTYYLFARDNALLRKKLVRKEKLLSSIYGGNQERLHTGLFLMFATLNKDVSFQKIENKILGEIDKIKKGKISKRGFVLSKKKALFDYYYSKETYTSLGSSVAYYAGLNKVKYYLNYPQLIKSVTIEKLKALVNKYFNKNNLSIVELYPIKGKTLKYSPSISGGIR